MDKIKKIINLECKFRDVIGYRIPTPDSILINKDNEIDKYISEFERSIKDKKDYITGKFGVTEESVRVFNSPPEKIIWD